MMKALRKGQTMVEYIIIVCLIAVSLIAVFTYLSRAIGKKAAGATSALSEEDASSAGASDASGSGVAAAASASALALSSASCAAKRAAEASV